MQAVILIGGLGTRLGDRVKDCPKPLLPVAGRPFVEHVLVNLRRFGFDDILLLAGYQASAVESLYGPDSDFARGFPGRVRVMVESAPLGTAGALAAAAQALGPWFLLLNGDSFFDINYLDLCREVAFGDGTAVGRIALRRVSDASRYGLVDLAGERVAAFREKPATPMPGLINAGAYWLSRSVLGRIERSPSSLEQDVFPHLARQGVLAGRVYDGFFIDIGIPADLERADEALPMHLTRPAVFFDRDGTLNVDAGYTHTIEGFQWLDGVPSMIKRLNDRGIFVFVVTNQAGVARGYYAESAVVELHRWMNQDLRRIGAHIDDFRYCPHHPSGTVPAYTRTCDCRKPGSRMIEDLLAQWPVRRARSLLLGDMPTDVAAGEAAGLATRLIPPGAAIAAIEDYLATLDRD
jgi:D-glycero-D-manno-heptose 1,7-bisphosphate phosphatase